MPMLIVDPSKLRNFSECKVQTLQSLLCTMVHSDRLSQKPLHCPVHKQKLINLLAVQQKSYFIYLQLNLSVPSSMMQNESCIIIIMQENDCSLTPTTDFRPLVMLSLSLPITRNKSPSLGIKHPVYAPIRSGDRSDTRTV